MSGSLIAERDDDVVTLLLEPADAGHELGLTSASVRRMAATGELVPVARTRRGVHLFKESDVQAAKLAREKKRG